MDTEHYSHSAIVLASLATLTSAMIVELFASGNSVAYFAASFASLSASSFPAIQYIAVSQHPVDIHHVASLQQDVDSIPVSGDVFVTCIFLVMDENNNYWLAVTEYLKKAACHNGNVLYHQVW